MKTSKKALMLLLGSSMLYSTTAGAQEFGLTDETEQLLGMNIENLIGMTGMQVSESKKEEFSSSKTLTKITDSPAAVYTITREDIRRSGATNIPEALRMAPGVQVARSASGDWNVSIRGFNAQFATKLLVLIDGRSVYTPLFSGVFWDEQDLLMEDIARIEVVRGPGGTLWGANAVNGVINIITKKARGTQGTLIDTTVGTGDDNFIASVRQGGKIGNDKHYRVYAKYRQYDENDQVGGADGMNQADIGRGGFRFDWRKSQDDQITIHGDMFYGQREELQVTTIPVFPFVLSSEDDIEIRGGNIVTKWDHTIDDDSSFTLQAYYDNNWRNFSEIELQKNTIDLDFQYSTLLGSRHAVTAGTDFRFEWDEIDGTAANALVPGNRSYKTYNAFVQDKITLIPEKLSLTLGSKFTLNPFSDYEHQPSARIGWNVAKNQFIWASISRAVRTPTRAEVDLDVALATPFGTFRVLGNDDTDVEKLVAYEMGYKNTVYEGVYFDAAVFYNDYDNLGSVTAVTPLLSTQDNGKWGETFGGELAINWDVNDKWNLKGSYSAIHVEIHGTFDATTNVPNTEFNTPHHQFNIASNYQFPGNLEMSNMLYRVNSLKTPSIDSYFRFDTRFSWEPAKGREFNFVVKNLFDDQHQEFQNARNNATMEIGRSFFFNSKISF